MLLAIVMISGCQTTSKLNPTKKSSNEYVCSMATKNSGRNWSTNFHYIYELKERGLSLKDCSLKYSTKHSRLDDDLICLNALSRDKKKWSENSYFIGYVQEAKIRGLDCGLEINSKTGKTSKRREKV